MSDDVFREIYHQHGPVLLHHLTRLTEGDRHRAEDILQETLLRAFRHPDARDATGRWSRPWLITVAQRIAIDQIRAAAIRPRERSDEDLSQKPAVDSGLDAVADRDEVRAALASLPARLRTVLIEIYYRDRSVADVAERLGIPSGTVKSRSYYALRALREALEERGFFADPD